MIRKIITYFRRLYFKLIWIHLISIDPKSTLLPEGKWYHCDYYIKRVGKQIFLDEFRMKELKSQRRVKKNA